MKPGIYIISFLFLILYSCQKPENRACWKSTGEETELEIILPSFDKILLHEHLEFVLIQDSVEKVVVIGGKNLVNFVKAEVTDGLLDIRNDNNCNFLRTYKKKIKVEVHFKSLMNIHYEGTYALTNVGTLEFGWLTFLIRDGSGSVNLNFNAEVVNATISHGWGDFTFTGNVGSANLNVRSNGYCNTYGLNIQDSLTVISNTQGYTKVNADGIKFKAEIDSDGDIYYKGTPSSTKLYKYGTGELIDAN